MRDKEGEYRACKVVYRASFQNDRPYEREYEGICKFEPVSRASESQVKILHVGRRDAAGCFYYIMELADDVHGGPALQPDSYVPKTLRSELERRGRLSAEECIEIGLSLSNALENLHQHGLIHRDIKPANIIFVNHIPKLADIGLVTEADVTVSYVGTGGFIPPEGPSSPQADVYGLGKVLYEISTGKDRLEYPELPVNFGDLPDRALLLELNSVVARACEADARKRYASASALHSDLMLLKRGKSIRQIRSSNRKWMLAVRLAVVLGAMLLAVMGVIHLSRKEAVRGDAATARTQLLDAVLEAQAEAELRQAYHAQIAGGNSAARRLAAAELVKQSSTTEDPAKQLAALRIAGQLAAEAGDLSLAMQTCDTMGAHFPIDKLAAKAGLLGQAAASARGPGKYGELAGLCQTAGFEAIAADDYDSGLKMAALAKTCAQNSGEKRHMKEAEFLDAEMNRCRDGFARVKQFEEILRRTPGDPVASFAVGQFLCFVKNDWEAGLLLMAHGTNVMLKSAVITEINKTPKTADDQIALGNSWRDLAEAASDEDKIHYLQRARYWYLKGLANSKEQDRDGLRQQLNKWIQAAPTMPGEIHISSRLVGTESIDIYSDEIRWKSGRRAVNGSINQVKLEDLKLGDLTIIKNNGVTRLLPDAVDFSTARLIINHKPKRQARSTLTIAPDHVRVTLAHPGPTEVELDVTVTFGNPP